MSRLLEGKVVCITGGLAGIGRALAVGFHNHGAHVAINYRSNKNNALLELQKEIPDLLSVQGDISDPKTSDELISAVVAKFGHLDSFISNAGICEFTEFPEMEPQVFQKHVNINLGGAFYSTQAAAKQLKKQGSGGSIIGVASVSAKVGGKGQVAYTPTKAGIVSLMQSEAVTLGEFGIRCNSLLPGTIETKLNKEDLSNEEKRKYMVSRIPLGRLGKPEDLVGAAVFLASDLSLYVTGAEILVDGGALVNFQ